MFGGWFRYVYQTFGEHILFIIANLRDSPMVFKLTQDYDAGSSYFSAMCPSDAKKIP